MTNQTMTVVTSGGEAIQVPFPLNANSIRGASFDRITRRGDIAAVLGVSTIKDCINAVAEAYGIDASDILGACRDREYVYPRQMAYLLARKATGRSYQVIGRAFKRDHSTVMSGISRCLARLDECTEDKYIYNRLLNHLGGARPVGLPSAAKTKLQAASSIA